MHETFLLILGLAGLLMIASFLLPLAHRLRIPHTVLLAAAGTVLGVVELAVGDERGLWILGDFLHALDTFDITSEIVFFVFLPALIFESALNISVRHLLDDVGPILLLAIIGLLISTVTVGVSVWAVADTAWAVADTALIACLLLGAIVSATDPVAVIAIFKDLGAPTRLTILVEGESLFNDATAIVLFTILAGMLTRGGADGGVLQAVGNFLAVFCGGILVGLLLGWLVASVIGQLHNLPLIEITLTVCLAYFAFLFAEHYLHVSGVMAVVSAGLITRSYGRTMVSPSTWHALFETWEQLGFWANSLIFFLVGLLVPGVLAGFTGTDLMTLTVLIVAAFGARAVTLYAVLPALNRMGLGQRISLAFRCVMLWGGLRGAVSLALALVILENSEFAPELQRFVVVLVTGFVLFTLFVNATTMPIVLRIFGLAKLPSRDLAIRNRIMALSLEHLREDLQQTARDYRIDPAVVHEVASDYERRVANLERTVSRDDRITEAERPSIALGAIVNQERQLYLRHFEEGLISAEITRMLLTRVVDNLQDGLKIGGIAGYREAVNKSLGFSPLFRFAMMLHRRFGVTTLLAARLANRFEVLRAMQAVVRALMDYNRETIASLLGEATATELEPLLSSRFDQVWTALERLRAHYPEYARTVQKRHLGRVALRLEDQSYRRMFADQVLSQELFNRLQRDLDKRGRLLDRQPRLDLGLEPAQLVARVPYFAELDQRRIGEIVKVLKPRLVVPGERIMSKGEVGDAMYFIASGAVEVATEPTPVHLGSGDFFGAIALITREPRKADFTAVEYCHLLVLEQQDFHRVLDAHPKLREIVHHTAMERLGTWFGAETRESS